MFFPCHSVLLVYLAGSLDYSDVFSHHVNIFAEQAGGGEEGGHARVHVLDVH